MVALPSSVSAQVENGFKKMDVRKEFSENGFSWFHEGELLAAGDKEKSNAMTIGWGGIGTLWGRTALTVYVAEKRYTKEFMDKSEYFTVMAFDVEHSNVLRYMGTKSGRDGDKAAALGLHTLYPGRCLPGNSHREVPAREGIPDIHYRRNDYQHPRDAACLTMKVELNLRALKLAGERIRSLRNGIDFEEYSDWYHFFLPKI